MKNQISLQGKPFTVKSVTKPVPNKQVMDIQSIFLKEAINKIITVKTVDGEEITGMLKFYDKFCLRIEITNKLRSLIYKSGITRIDFES